MGDSFPRPELPGAEHRTQKSRRVDSSATDLRAALITRYGVTADVWCSDNEVQHCCLNAI